MKSKILLTPGPLTTSALTKNAMQTDFGSRSQQFTDVTSGVLEKLRLLSGCASDQCFVPIQGSGTYAVEAMLGTLLPKESPLLVLVNGAYGKRIGKIAARFGHKVHTLNFRENEQISVEQCKSFLELHKEVQHIAVVHVETTAGIINPIAELLKMASEKKVQVLVDAVSAFGSVPISYWNEPSLCGLALSANKGLESVPGIALVNVRKSYLEQCEGRSPSLSLDLYDQWKQLMQNGQWRFTPPTHVVAALLSALTQLEEEGGIGKRYERYQKNCALLRSGMQQLGFECYVEEKFQAPVIVTFHVPKGNWFEFESFYNALDAKGFEIYPGKVTEVETFRVGCIGHVFSHDIEQFLTAVKQSKELLERAG